MATLDEAHEQLQAWIGEIDQRIEELSLQRRAMIAALMSLGVEVSVGTVEAAVYVHPHAGMTTVVEQVPDPPVSPKPPPKGMPARLKKPKKQAPSRPGESKYDYAEVARVATAASRDGLSMSGAVADHLHVSASMGSFLVVEARKRGHDVPRRATKAKAEPTSGRGGIVTPIVTIAPVGTRAFTPDDTLRILERG